jgi:hypothetical protein
MDNLKKPAQVILAISSICIISIKLLIQLIHWNFEKATKYLVTSTWNKLDKLFSEEGMTALVLFWKRQLLKLIIKSKRETSFTNGKLVNSTYRNSIDFTGFKNFGCLMTTNRRTTCFKIWLIKNRQRVMNIITKSHRQRKCAIMAWGGSAAKLDGIWDAER